MTLVLPGGNANHLAIVLPSFYCEHKHSTDCFFITSSACRWPVLRVLLNPFNILPFRPALMEDCAALETRWDALCPAYSNQLNNKDFELLRIFFHLAFSDLLHLDFKLGQGLVFLSIGRLVLPMKWLPLLFFCCRFSYCCIFVYKLRSFKNSIISKSTKKSLLRVPTFCGYNMVRVLVQ